MSENLVQFVLDAQQGNEDAFAKLYSNTLKSSYYLCLKLTADNEAAQQVLKDAYAVAFNSVDKLKRPEAFEAWLKQKIAGVYKDTQTFVFSDADGAATALSAEFLPASVLEDESLCRKLEDTVSYLPKEQRTVTVLHYYVGMPVDFIGKFLSVSVSTVNSLLAKARATIIDSLPEAPDTVAEDTLPVLTRIFQTSAGKTAVDVELVRSTFLYAVERYEAKDAAADEGEDTQSGADDSTGKNEEPPTIVIDSYTKPSSVVQTGDELLKEIHRSISEFTDDGEVDIPDIDSQVGEYISTEGEPEPETDAFPVETDSSLVGKKTSVKKKLSPKTLLYAGIALLLVIVIAIVCAVAFKKSKNPDPAENPSNISDVTAGVSTEWKNDVFTGYSEIEYMNEYCCKFLSTDTQKWGLMNYNGDVVLAPSYYEIIRCSYGRQYKTDRNNYHILARLEAGGSLYEVNMETFAISDTPHAQHGVNEDEVLDDIDTDDYSDRDRYHNGYAAVQDAKTGKWGYITEDGHKLVIKCNYESANIISDQSKGRETAMMDYCMAVENNMVAVRKGGKMGVISLNEDVLVNFDYDTILQGSNGVFIACKNGQWGVILVGDSAIANYERNTSTSDTAALDVILQTAEKVEGTYEVVRMVNVRSEAGSSSDDTKIGEIEVGGTVTGVAEFTDEDGKGWLCFEYNGGYAWGRSTFFEKVESDSEG